MMAAGCTMTHHIALPEAELAEVCRKYQVKELALFGSTVLGRSGPDSDIDLLVDFLPGANISLLGHAAAARELSALLGRKVDLVSKRALRPSLREEILSQARVVYAA